MNKDDVLLLTELRDACRAWKDDPQADTRVAAAIEALACRALRDEPEDAEIVEPANDNAGDDVTTEEAPATAPKTFHEL